MPTQKMLTEPKGGWLFEPGPVVIKYVEQSGDAELRKGHYHKTRHEYFIVLKGEISININGNDYNIGEMGAICVYPGEIHKIKRIRPGTKYLCIGPTQVPFDNVEIEKGIKGFD